MYIGPGPFYLFTGVTVTYTNMINDRLNPTDPNQLPREDVDFIVFNRYDGARAVVERLCTEPGRTQLNGLPSAKNQVEIPRI